MDASSAVPRLFLWGGSLVGNRVLRAWRTLTLHTKRKPMDHTIKTITPHQDLTLTLNVHSQSCSRTTVLNDS
eukprot:8999667-Lingulodinium_polyedra.AAC.1